jgi:tetratricopeptide (TPR) repeat protein
LFEKGVRLFEQQEYDQARFEFVNITSNFPEYGQVEDYIAKCEEGSRRIREESTQQSRLATLKDEYNSAKDLQYKINVGEMILQIEFDEDVKNEIEKMRVAVRELGTVFDPARLNQEMLRLQEEVSNQRKQETLNRINNLISQGYWELANNELTEARTLFNEPNWQESIKNEIDLQMAKMNEEKIFQETLKGLYDGAFTDYVNERYNSALNRISRLLELDKEYPEANELKRRIESALQRTGQKVVESEGVVLESERRLMQARVERLYQEGLSFYMAGNIPEARQRWEEILEMQPDNEKVRQYLRVIR